LAITSFARTINGLSIPISPFAKGPDVHHAMQLFFPPAGHRM
jgi:hypothetical protein